MCFFDKFFISLFLSLLISDIYILLSVCGFVLMCFFSFFFLSVFLSFFLSLLALVVCVVRVSTAVLSKLFGQVTPLHSMLKQQLAHAALMAVTHRLHKRGTPENGLDALFVDFTCSSPC